MKDITTHIVVILIILVTLGTISAASSYTFNFNAEAQPPLPFWLDAASRTQNIEGRQTLVIPIKPLQETPHLAVTLIYREQSKQTLTVSWKADGDSQPFILSKNVMEELNGTRNQKTLILEHSLIGTGGALIIDYSSPDVAPSKVALDWVASTPVLSEDQETSPALIASSGRQIDRQALLGEPFAASPDKLGKNVIDATLIGSVEPLDDPLEVELSLVAPVKGARISIAVIGLPLNVGVSAYANGQYLGELQLETPGLDDPGYDFDQGQVVYAGWRTGTLLVSHPGLKQNENTITFAPSAADANAQLTDAAYIRDARVQIIYDESTASTP